MISPKIRWINVSFWDFYPQRDRNQSLHLNKLAYVLKQYQLFKLVGSSIACDCLIVSSIGSPVGCCSIRFNLVLVSIEFDSLGPSKQSTAHSHRFESLTVTKHYPIFKLQEIKMLEKSNMSQAACQKWPVHGQLMYASFDSNKLINHGANKEDEFLA